MAIVKIGGADLDVVELGRGRHLVLLHSLLTDRSAFDLVVPELSRSRRLVLVNLPGYGASTAAGADVESYADRLADLLHTLDLPRRSDILGNGFGGFISIALAARQMRGFGGMITFELESEAAARAMLGRVRLMSLAESLGGVETLISHPASMTHASVPPERRAQIGLTGAMVRISAGIEDVDDLIEDLKQALG